MTDQSHFLLSIFYFPKTYLRRELSRYGRQEQYSRNDRQHATHSFK